MQKTDPYLLMKISSQSRQQKGQNTSVGCVNDEGKQEEIDIPKTNVIRILSKLTKKERTKKQLGGLPSMHPIIRRHCQSIKILCKLNL
jgi:hypothetical protein